MYVQKKTPLHGNSFHSPKLPFFHPLLKQRISEEQVAHKAGFLYLLIMHASQYLIHSHTHTLTFVKKLNIAAVQKP